MCSVLLSPVVLLHMAFTILFCRPVRSVFILQFFQELEGRKSKVLLPFQEQNPRQGLARAGPVLGSGTCLLRDYEKFHGSILYIYTYISSSCPRTVYCKHLQSPIDSTFVIQHLNALLVSGFSTLNDYVGMHASPLDACLWRAVGRCPRQHLQKGHLPPAPLATQQELSCMDVCPALTWTHDLWPSPRLGTAAAEGAWVGKARALWQQLSVLPLRLFANFLGSH